MKKNSLLVNYKKVKSVLATVKTTHNLVSFIIIIISYNLW